MWRLERLDSCMWHILNFCWSGLYCTCSFQSRRQLGAARPAHNGSLACHELTAITDPGTECSGDREPSLISVQCRIRKVTSSARSLRWVEACHWEDRAGQDAFPRTECSMCKDHKAHVMEKCSRMWGALVEGGGVAEIRIGSGCLPERIKSKVLTSFHQAPGMLSIVPSLDLTPTTSSHCIPS